VSLLVIVPEAVTSAVKSEPLNFIDTVSSDSTVVSPRVEIETVAVFCPAANTTVPALLVKSSPAEAVPVVRVS
jgi:hypothetical protein